MAAGCRSHPCGGWSEPGDGWSAWHAHTWRRTVLGLGTVDEEAQSQGPHIESFRSILGSSSLLQAGRRTHRRS